MKNYDLLDTISKSFNRKAKRKRSKVEVEKEKGKRNKEILERVLKTGFNKMPDSEEKGEK